MSLDTPAPVSPFRNPSMLQDVDAPVVERWSVEHEPADDPSLTREVPASANGSTWAASWPTLRRGADGEPVRRLQQALTQAGHPVPVDGDFGPATVAAVRAFQGASGLAVDGVVGPATWRLLMAPSAPPTSPQPPPDRRPAAAPSLSQDVPLGTLVVQAPGRHVRYDFTSDDLIWTAKLLVHEAGGRDDANNAAVLWAMINRFGLFTHRSYYRTFASFIRSYSTTLQPELRSAQAAARHAGTPEFVESGRGNYPGTDIPRGQLRRHLDVQKAPWESIKPAARALATRALTGGLVNPGIGLASEFASTRIYYRQAHGRQEPSRAQWKEYTLRHAARKKWRWVGDVPGLDQMKNAFFLDLRVADLPAGSVRVLAPGQTATTVIDDEHEWDQPAGEWDEWEPDEWEPDEWEPDEWGPEEWTEEDSDEEWGAPEAQRDADQEAEGVGDAVSSALGSARNALGQVWENLVRQLIESGMRDENALVDRVFHGKHPGRGGRPIGPDEPELAAKWRAIRDDLVRPMLAALRPRHVVDCTTATADCFVKQVVAQVGDRYEMGAKPKGTESDPSVFDCSGLVRWGAARVGAQPMLRRGSWLQLQDCDKHDCLITVADGLATRGALLFRFHGGDPYGARRPHDAHVAVSLGDDRVVEAAGKAVGVLISQHAKRRGWTHAARVPGLDYGAPAAALAREVSIGGSWPGRPLLHHPFMTGHDVRSWQQGMIARGWPLVADGRYGPASALACRRFQSQQGLVSDGVVDRETWEATFRGEQIPN